MYAGDEKVHEGGVAIMMSKRAERALMEWTPVSERITTARFYSHFRRLLVIQVYAPHEREEEKKDHFCEELQQAIDRCNRNDIVVVMGDFDAKVGGDSEGYESGIGKHGMEDKNDNGESERGYVIFRWEMAWSSQEHCINTKIFTRQHGSRQMGE